MKRSKNNRPHGRIGRAVLKILLILAIVFTISATVIGIVFAIYVEKNIDKSVDESMFVTVGTGAQTKIFCYDYSDRSNRIGEAYELTDEQIYGGYRCSHVEYEELPQDLIDAFISIEDKRFMSHHGVDWKRTISAGANYFLKFNKNFGGSTITQQLIKNVTENDEYSFQRKIQEIFWALDLETKMDKKEILLSYLNIINLSDGCFGVGAAAEYYFSKDVSELTLNECACIAAITNSPYYYNPIRNPENNKQRRNLIIEQMYLQGYISEEEYTSAYDAEVTLNTSDTGEADKINSWYVDMVIEDVIDDLINEMGYSRSMAALMLYTGGLNIYITMDPDVQKVLDKYYSEPDNFYAPGNDENPQSSMIVIDPQTGDILGVAGAVGTKNANRIQNFATQTLRPAGSVIKPLSVYAPALEEGAITWASVFDDVPVNFGNYNLDEESGRIVYPVAWPRNAYGTYRGLTNVNYALTHSLNTVTVRVLEELGLEKSFHYLYDDLDMKSLIYSRVLDDGSKISDMDYAALAMGQFNYGVTVRETTAAYSIFANNGVYNSTRSYLKVTDGRGNTVLEKPYSGKAVLSEANASIMTLMLRNVVYGGTAKEITLKNRIDVAGKTGTTQNSCDRWFIGYTPYYICGTWFGYEYPKPLTAYSSNPCNRIWNEVMEILHEKYFDAEQSGTPLKSFVISDDVVSAEYCADSGKILTEACRHDPRGSRTEVGYFVKGTEPTEYCDTHVLVDYDTEYGGIACPECPSAKTVKVGLIKVMRVFPMQIYVTDAEYVYRDIGTQTMPETSSSLPFFANLLGENEYSGISNSQTQYNRYCREHFNYHEWKKRKDGG